MLHSWSAVARGAALHGLGAVKVEKRMLRRHYGQEVCRAFRPGIDPTSGPRWETRWKNLFTDELMIWGHMSWILAKVPLPRPKANQHAETDQNSVFDDTTEAEYSWSLHHTQGQARTTTNILYSCSLNEAPDDADHNREFVFCLLSLICHHVLWPFSDRQCHLRD